MDLQIARSYDDLATNQKLDETRVLLKSDFSTLDAKIDSVRMELKAEIERAKVYFLRGMIFAMTTQTAALAGLIKLFMPHSP